MTDSMVNIEHLVQSLVEPLVDYPEEVQITSSDLEDGALLIEIQVHSDDAGKVIGRQGRVIKAIRTLSRAAGSRNDQQVEVELVD